MPWTVSPLEIVSCLRNVIVSGHDQRLERMMESSLMVMEAFEGHEGKFTYDIVGHSGEEAAIPFVMGAAKGKGPGRGEPRNEKERLEGLREIHAHAQVLYYTTLDHS